jgi:hypothetical protein
MTSNSFQRQFSRFYSQELKKSFDSTSGDSFLLFFGRTVPWGLTFAGDPTTGSENSPPGNANSLGERYDAWRNAIGGKLLEPRDVYHVFKRINWVHNTVYKPYADNVDIHDGTYNFYVLTDENNVYKCLDNGSGKKSIVKPTGTSTSIFTTDDTYIWKFMFKVTEDSKKFLNLDYIPCKYVTQREENETLAQYNVQTTAVDGSIDFVGMTGTNAAYWSNTTQQSDQNCRVVGPASADVGPDGHLQDTDPNVGTGDFNGKGDKWVKVAYPSGQDLSNLPNWSDNNGRAIYFHYGVGPEVGQLRHIINHVKGSNGALLNLDKPLGADLSDSDNLPTQYVIAPHIVVNGDGENAMVRAVCDIDGKIEKVKIINRGEKYRNASVSFKTDSEGQTVPTLVPHISPVGGHGANPIVDFNASEIMINVKMDGEEGGDFLIGDDIRQYGLIKNPTISGGGASGGGANTNTIAGTEFSKTKYFDIIPTHVNTTPFNYDTEVAEQTFKSGEYIMGAESRATARIVSWRKKVGSGVEGDQGVLEVDKIRGEFSIPIAQVHEVRYVFNAEPALGEETNVVTGYPIWQFGNEDGVGSPNGPSGKGIVTGYSREDNELTVQLKSGSLGTGGDLYVNYTDGNEVKFNETTITLFENKGGELLKSYTVAGNGDISFRNYGTTQDCARARNTTEIVSLYDRIPTYNLTHKLIIRDDQASLEIGTFAAGQELRQVITNGTVTSGTVSKWIKSSGTTGEIVVSNVLNSFKKAGNDDTGEFSVVGETTGESKIITGIQIPELNIGSGEMLYIQNMRPITRSFEQQEEFKIILGF